MQRCGSLFLLVYFVHSCSLSDINCNVELLVLLKGCDLELWLLFLILWRDKINFFCKLALGLTWSDFLNLRTYWLFFLLSYFLTYLYLLPYKLPLLYSACGNKDNLHPVQLNTKDIKIHPRSVLPGYNTQMQICVCFLPLIYLNNVVLFSRMKENVKGVFESNYTSIESSHAASDDVRADWIVSRSRGVRHSLMRDECTSVVWVKKKLEWNWQNIFRCKYRCGISWVTWEVADVGLRPWGLSLGLLYLVETQMYFIRA